MKNEDVMAVAHRAAELLPEPPAPHDPFGYLAWEELVLATGRRLQRFFDDETLLAPASTVATAALRLIPSSGRLDAVSLITIALLLLHDEGSCEALLADAVSTGRGVRSVVESIS